jgi:hypothetical protein
MFQSHLPNPEEAAAKIVIGLIEIKRQRLEDATLGLMDRKIRYRKNAPYAEKVARYLLGTAGLTEPAIALAMVPIADHFLALPDDAPLPTEQQVVEWIANNGGLAAFWQLGMRAKREG